jgi:hypothetical protein
MARWFKVAFLSSCVMGMSVPAVAQHDAFMETYGQAVHKYFAGDVTGSERLLQDVLGNGAEDPRVHYFLGLCKVRQGGGVTAGLVDFEEGARLEAEKGKSLEVGRALQRVQGAVRVEIEKARLAARKTVALQKALEQRSRIESMPAAPSTVPPATNTNPADNQPIGETTVDPVQPAAPDASNPFGDESAPAKPGDAPTTEEPAGDLFSPPATEAPSPFE